MREIKDKADQSEAVVLISLFGWIFFFNEIYLNF